MSTAGNVSMSCLLQQEEAQGVVVLWFYGFIRFLHIGLNVARLITKLLRVLKVPANSQLHYLSCQ
jgi:hypothetical protein